MQAVKQDGDFLPRKLCVQRVRTHIVTEKLLMWRPGGLAAGRPGGRAALLTGD